MGSYVQSIPRTSKQSYGRSTAAHCGGSSACSAVADHRLLTWIQTFFFLNKPFSISPASHLFSLGDFLNQFGRALVLCSHKITETHGHTGFYCADIFAATVTACNPHHQHHHHHHAGSPSEEEKAEELLARCFQPMFCRCVNGWSADCHGLPRRRRRQWRASPVAIWSC